jgi:arginine-tRNA-protein transferase
VTERLQLGVSPVHACSYLADQQERLVFTLPDQPMSAEFYQHLTEHNFRRSSDVLYRPYCLSCQACQAVRINPAEFKLHRSQRRLIKKAEAAGWHWVHNTKPTAADSYDLYQRYIAARHADGIMYPAAPDHLEQLLTCSWLQVSTLEQYLDDRLVGVMVLDHLPHGLSAVYSFYHCPDPCSVTTDPGPVMAFGTLAILAGLQLTQALNLPFFYLGYLVEGSAKMQYKARFTPQQRLIDGIWQTFR